VSALVVLLALLAVLVSGVPIAFALGGLGLVLLLMNGLPPIIIAQNLYGGIDNFVLLAVPLFLMMSNVLLKGGVGRDLYAAVQSWVGHWPGGLAVATIISCALFSAISGSSVATAATIATIAIPEMLSRGYERGFVFGLLAAGGTLGILIPPSIPLIVYGVVAEESIVSLFLAGIGPGLMLSVAFIVFAMLHARFGKQAHIRGARATGPERVRASLRALPTAMLAAIILAGIYLGVFTPTEAAGVGFVLALALTVFVLRTMSWALLRESMLESLKTTVTILLIVVGAKIFAKSVTLFHIPQDVSSLILTAELSAAGFMFVVCALLLVMGFFLESLSMLLIVVPLLHPALAGMGIDAVWFGIAFMIMIECALITPPVGMNLFVIQAVAKARLGEVTRGVWPFIVIMLASVVLIYLFPDIVLFIPFKL